jgi:TolB protein
LDNDIVLVDPRASRHHAEGRQTAAGVLEIKDLNSANGVVINQNRLEPDVWHKMAPGQIVQLAETRIIWEKAVSSQSTVAMTRQSLPPTATAAPAPPAVVERPTTSMMPWVIGLGGILVLLLVVGLALTLIFGGLEEGEEAATQPEVIETPASPTETPSPSAGRGAEGSLAQQTTVVGPTDTPTPTGPQLAIPVMEIVSIQVSPIIFGASPSTNRAYIFIDVRVRNSGNIPFQFSISNFVMQTRDGQIFKEAGSNTSELYLKQLGAIDRFENLALTPGGSVPGSLVFELEINVYDLELTFNAPDIDPIVLGLGTINMARELSLAAGTPLAALETGTEVTPTPTLVPTPTPTRPPEIPAPRVVPRSALAGTIAYPVFNETDFDIYLGQVDGSGTRFFRAHASQPAFSPDGSRIAFHSWDNSSRGLMTMDTSGANPRIVASFIEDQLPVWSADGKDIVFLSRRSGDRKSHLMKVDSSTEGSEGTVMGEGEYPTIGPSGQLIFKGWGNTAFGLRLASSNMENVQTITNVEEDTAPALSPDGQKVAFMSRREENWDIYVADTDGSNLQRLTNDPAQDGLPTWSPDGNAIAFVSNRGGPWAVWVMTPDGKGQSQLFTMEGSPDGFVGTDTYASRGWAEERISWTKE